MFFEGPKLRHAFSGSGGKTPKPEEPPGFFDAFKAAVVNRKGPVICQQLNDALKTLIERHSNHGVPKDVQTHFALKAISSRVESFRETIDQGGAEAYAKLKEAKKYVGRLQTLGLEA